MDKKSHLVQSHTDEWQHITPLAVCPLAIRPPIHPYIVTTVTIPKWKGEKTVLQGAKDWFKITPFPFLILFYPSPSVHPSNRTVLTLFFLQSNINNNCCHWFFNTASKVLTGSYHLKGFFLPNLLDGMALSSPHVNISMKLLFLYMRAWLSRCLFSPATPCRRVTFCHMNEHDLFSYPCGLQRSEPYRGAEETARKYFFPVLTRQAVSAMKWIFSCEHSPKVEYTSKYV